MQYEYTNLMLNAQIFEMSENFAYVSIRFDKMHL